MPVTLLLKLKYNAERKTASANHAAATRLASRLLTGLKQEMDKGCLLIAKQISECKQPSSEEQFPTVVLDSNESLDLLQ